MESIQNLKRRIKGVQNIGQITKAMEMVAATKMRKAQEIALDSRPYAYSALEILASLSKLDGVPKPDLMQSREVKRTLFVLVTSDKGLAGSFNGAVIRAWENFMKREHVDCLDGHHAFIAIGQKSKQYLERQKLPIVHSFVRAGDFTKRADSDPIAELLINGYRKGDWDEIMVFSTLFVTALRQDVIQRQLLPISFENLKETAEELIPRAGRYSHYLDPDHFDLGDSTSEKPLPSIASKDGRDAFPPLKRGGAERVEYIIEPSPGEVLEHLAPELLKIRLYDWLMEANASEHSARRMAMKSASDNASELSEGLSVEYNKSRQAAITSQIIEITSGAQT
jgi:F-type H+-transporting ATPase subunit gamma